MTGPRANRSDVTPDGSVSSPPRDRVITGGTVVTPTGVREVDVLIRGSKIAEVGEDLPTDGVEVLDASNMLVVPGGIDAHVHLEAGTQGQETSDDFVTGTKAAAVGGTTTVIDFCYQTPGTPLVEGLASRLAVAQGRAVVDFAFHFVVKVLDSRSERELAEVVAAGVTSFKTYMAYPRRGLMADDATIYRLFERAAALGGLPVVHAENGLVTDVLIDEAHAQRRLGPAEHAHVHTAAGEAEGTHRALAIAAMVGAPTYFVHVSCAEALSEIEAARQRGQIVFAETCPHYLLLDESRYQLEGFEAAKYVMNPPLRAPENKDVLWDGLARNAVNTVATDHCPFNFQGQKDRGREDFSLIPNGAPGIETRIALLFNDGVREKRISLERWVDAFAASPARIFGLVDKGRLEPGADADVVIFDPEREVTIRQKNQHMRVDYSLYEGKSVRGWPRTVLSRGDIIVRDGEYVGADGRGQFLRRTPPALSRA